MRYLDLFVVYISAYNTFMKIVFIGITLYTVYLIRYGKPYSQTYDEVADEFPHLKIIYPAAAVATILIHKNFTIVGLTYSYSLWLESIAFIP